MVVMAVAVAAPADELRARWRGRCAQALLVLLMNVPTMSFGLALGWVSVASGEGGAGGEGGELVWAAASTFGAALLGVPLSARLLVAGRKPAIIATSAAFVVCWSLKLVGDGWWVVWARVAAGLGGAGAWCVVPLLAKETCSEGCAGAAVGAVVVAHNVGVLLMYVAADARLDHRTVVWWCLALSLAHCVAFLFMPESPAYLAANGKHDEAGAALCWLRGRRRSHPALAAELAALAAQPARDVTRSPLQRVRHLLSDRRRRRAFVLAAIAVVGQEMCGVLALLQFAERVFVLARGSLPLPFPPPPSGDAADASPARLAVLLGAAQLAASLVALYLVERVGRRPLLVSAAFVTGLCLAGGAAAVWLGVGARWVRWLLAGAVAADSGGLQPAPYAMLADMFHYQHRGCALMLVSALACAGNAAEVVVFPLVASALGLAAALALAGSLTLAYATFAVAALPETRGRTPEQIYARLCPDNHKPVDVTEECSTQTEYTKC